MAESVKVIVRCRPMNKREKDLRCKVRTKSVSSSVTEMANESSLEEMISLHQVNKSELQVTVWFIDEPETGL
jgi:hypothetical protein